MTRSAPRYWSKADGFDHSWRRLFDAVPRTTRLAGLTASYRTVPSVAVTRSRQVVLGPVAVVVVVGTRRSAASTGKVLAMPSIVQLARRP